MSEVYGITIGDVCGVGPEILVRTFLEPDESGRTYVVFGDRVAIDLVRDTLGLSVDVHTVHSPDEAQPGRLNLIDFSILRREDITIGEVSAKCGAAAVTYVEEATRAALAGSIAGFVTLPINKEACRHSHPDFQGHTELIAEMCGVEDYVLMLASENMIATHVSTHVSLREAIERTRKERILTVTRLTHKYATTLRARARIAIAGLNPHAGEHGAFGTEEIEEIEPAIAAARAEGIDAHGPVPPDTLFMKAFGGEYDAVVCMYHDQGHIAMKLHGFTDAVNVTAGLPITRTSVDHGTAFDIAYKGLASIENFKIATDMCARLSAET